LQTISIGSNGEITGVFSNGQNKSLGQLALATFKNPSGLLNVGNSFYAESNNSGMPLIGQSDSEGRGQIIVGTVEMSNVDLAKEFADMIVAQRGFQANSKIISASDEMLQELVRMKK
jgi:flagellar hook protein FlgE